MTPDERTDLRHAISAAISDKNADWTGHVGRAEVAAAVIDALEAKGWRLTPPRTPWWHIVWPRKAEEA